MQITCLSSDIMHHGMHSILLSKASFITCSAYESEKMRGDQVSKRVYPLEMLVSIGSLCEN
jgi:hypothetical protein